MKIDLSKGEIKALLELLSLVVNVETIDVDVFPAKGHEMYGRLNGRFQAFADAAGIDMQLVDYVWRKNQRS
jgi:hypothetical protein